MIDRSFLDWPFFEERHRALAGRLEAWAAQHCRMSITTMSMRPAAIWCTQLGRDGWLKHTAPGDDPAETLDVRTLA